MSYTITPTTLDASSKDADVTLSGGNLSAAFSGKGAVRSALAVPAGRFYFEVAINTMTTPTLFIGLVKSNFVMTGGVIGTASGQKRYFALAFDPVTGAPFNHTAVQDRLTAGTAT